MNLKGYPKAIKQLLRKVRTKGAKFLVLYIYPKDNTPGCTIEAVEFSSLKEEFEKLGAYIVGVSKDSAKSHENFIKKHDLTIELVSDTELEIIKALDALKPKKRFGKEYMGVVRSTFIFNVDTGEIIQEFRDVKAKGHAAQVLEWLKQNLSKHGRRGKRIKLSEVAKHDKETDCWVIINNKVYDVTKLLKNHSGGREVILPYCGKDATAAFEGKPHSKEAEDALQDYYIGDLEELS